MPQMTGRVLIVDDDGVTTEIFARALKLEGHEVRTAANAEAGLRESGEWQPNAIVLDLRMPFINGLGFLYRLRACKDFRGTPVVIVTGDQCLEDATIAEIGALGAEVHFKPLCLEDLVCLVEKLLVASQPGAGPSGSSRFGRGPATTLH